MREFNNNSRFLLRLEDHYDFDVFSRTANGVRLGGDISLVAFRESPGADQEISLSLEYLGLVGDGAVVRRKGPTGAISVLGLSGGGNVSIRTDETAFVQMPFTARVLYDAVDDQLGFKVRGDRFVSFVETFSGKLKGTLRRIEGPGGSLLVFEQGALTFAYENGGLGWIRDLAIPLDGFPLKILQPPEDIAEPIFSLLVQPVAFKVSPDDPSPSGVNWESQLKRAQEAWHHCGIQLDVQKIEPVVNKDLKRSRDVREMRRGWKARDPRAIEVYFSAEELPDGGGQSVSCGAANAAIAVTDHDSGRENLVAHEIGHILLGIHPHDPYDSGEWRGDEGSVLEPIGVPVQIQVSEANCKKARNAAMRIIR
jgi:hypothetical protein